ncbi:MAG: NUDIX domain-containing protein [Bacteroidota bacterium]
MPELPVEQRAGGIVFREESNRIEFLLVTSNSNRNRWIIPAGHVEVGETPRETALREVEEEAGVKADILSDLGVLNYVWYRSNQKIMIETHLYLMKYVNTIAVNPEGRQVGFFSFEQTNNLNMWEESRFFLKKAWEAAESRPN